MPKTHGPSTSGENSGSYPDSDFEPSLIFKHYETQDLDLPAQKGIPAGWPKSYFDPPSLNDSQLTNIHGRVGSSDTWLIAHPTAAQDDASQLNAAIYQGDLEVADFLIESGANPNEPFDSDIRMLFNTQATPGMMGGSFPQLPIGGLPIQVAARNGAGPKFIKMLLDAGAIVDGRCASERDTALQLACSQNSYENVKLLLDAGADVNAPAGENGTALDIALETGKQNGLAYIDLLLQHGAFLEDAHILGPFKRILLYDTPSHLVSPLLKLYLRTGGYIYHSEEELTSEIFDANAFRLLKLIRMQWRMPNGLLPAVGGSKRANLAPVISQNRLETQFVLVMDDIIGLKVLGTTCEDFVFRCWGKEGLLVLRWMTCSLSQVYNAETNIDQESFEKDWKDSALSRSLSGLSIADSFCDVKLGPEPLAALMVRTVIGVLTFITTAITDPSSSDTTRFEMSTPLVYLEYDARNPVDKEGPLFVKIAVSKCRLFVNGGTNSNSEDNAQSSKHAESHQHSEEEHGSKSGEMSSEDTDAESNSVNSIEDEDLFESRESQSSFKNLASESELSLRGMTFEISEGNCWQKLFHGATVARSWGRTVLPIASGKGLCMSYEHMVSLAGIEYSVAIGKTIVLVGYRTALIPTLIDEAFTQYHLLVSKSGQINLSLFSKEVEQAISVPDGSMLRDRCCFVGWCGAADIQLGTKEFTKSAQIHISGAKERKRTAQLSAIGLGLSIYSATPVQIGPTVQLTCSFVLNKAKFQSLVVYSQLLRDSARKLALLYDVDANTRRGWVVPKLSLLLFMCHWYIIKIAKEQINPKLFVSDSPDQRKILQVLDPLGDLVLCGSGSDSLQLRTLITGLNMNLDSIIEKTQSANGTSLYGFEFLDIANAPAKGAWMRKASTSPNGEDIINMAKLVDAVVFGAGFGDVIRRQPSDSNFANSAARSANGCINVPFGFNYVTVPVHSLIELASDRHRDVQIALENHEVELKDGICWLVSRKAFKPCLHTEDEKETCWNREETFQHLGRPSTKLRKSVNGVNALPPIPDGGAVVFGRPMRRSHR